MLINRESDYGLRVLRSLEKKSPQTMQEISEEQHVPSQYIYKITKKLANADLVTIRQGRNGGCSLNCELSKITLLDVLQATGDDLVINACISEKFSCSFKETNNGHCAIHDNLHNIEKKLKEQLNSVFVSSLMDL